MLEVTWISADLSFECAQTANVPSPFPAHKECYLRASWGDSYITALWHPTGYQDQQSLGSHHRTDHVGRSIGT